MPPSMDAKASAPSPQFIPFEIARNKVATDVALGQLAVTGTSGTKKYKAKNISFQNELRACVRHAKTIKNICANTLGSGHTVDHIGLTKSFGAAQPCRPAAGHQRSEE